MVGNNAVQDIMSKELSNTFVKIVDCRKQGHNSKRKNKNSSYNKIAAFDNEICNFDNKYIDIMNDFW